VKEDCRRLFRSQGAYDAAMHTYDDALAQLRRGCLRQYVETDYGHTYTVSIGPQDAPPVVLWHGMNVNLTMWVPLMNLLADRYRVMAIDTIGNQGRSAPTRPDKRTAAHARWGQQVLDGLGVARAHHVGFSQGGWLVFRLAEMAADRIASAVLLSCAGLVPVDYRLLLRMSPALLVREPERRARTLIRLLSAPNHVPNPYEVRVFMNMQHYALEGTIPTLSDHQLRAVTAPLLFIMGAYDRTFRPVAAIRRVRRVLGHHADALLLSGLSHGLEENQPLVHQTIINFLNRQESL
jgi:pimeloyl-ACP methyl ester carboxylesterase